MVERPKIGKEYAYLIQQIVQGFLQIAWNTGKVICREPSWGLKK